MSRERAVEDTWFSSITSSVLLCITLPSLWWNLNDMDVCSLSNIFIRMVCG